MKKNIILTLLSFTFFICMAGCVNSSSDYSANTTDNSISLTETTQSLDSDISSHTDSNTDSNIKSNPDISSSEDVSSETNQPSSEETLPPEQLALYTACQNALRNLYEQSILPDGKTAKNKPDFFLIREVDVNNETENNDSNDSIAELILAWNSSSSFGDIFYVYQYDADTDSFHVKWNQSTSVKLYDKDIILKPVSVNYGLSSTPDFYPYGIYQYQEDKNAYLFQAYVDAWQKSFLSSDYTGKAYPSKIDTENAGMVYSIFYCKEGDDYVNDYKYSQSMYEDFCAENFGNQITTEQMSTFDLEEIENIL